MFHHTTDQCCFTVGDGVDIDFDRVFEELVDQHRMIGRDVDRLDHELDQLGIVVADLHAASAQDEARSHEDGVADSLSGLTGLLDGEGCAVGWLAEVQLIQQHFELLAVFSDIDHLGTGADDRYARSFESLGQVQWRLATELHDDSIGLEFVTDVEDIFGGQRFEEQNVRGVIISRHRLGVRVDHDALDAEVTHRVRRVAAAVVELDALTDTVGTTAEDHDPLLVERSWLMIDRRAGQSFLARDKSPVGFNQADSAGLELTPCG